MAIDDRHGFAPFSGGSDDVSELRCRLLAWWDLHGRHAMSLKLRRDGSLPADGEPIDPYGPYGVFVAEVRRAARQHSCSMDG